MRKMETGKIIINSRYHTDKNEYGGEINIKCQDISTFLEVLNFLENITEGPLL